MNHYHSLSWCVSQAQKHIRFEEIAGPEGQAEEPKGEEIVGPDGETLKPTTGIPFFL